MDLTRSDDLIVGLVYEIANGICERALWYDGCCNWIVETAANPEPAAATHSHARYCCRSLGPDLYAGTAGVALTLSRIAVAGGPDKCAQTALGAMRHALRHADEVVRIAPAGFYTGAAGIAYAAIITGSTCGDIAIAADGRRLLNDALTAGIATAEFDVFTGAAGGIFAATAIGDELGDWSAIPLAHRLTACLAASAHRSVRGWCWTPTHGGFGLTGMSHGTAGVIAAFSALSRSTSDSTLAKVIEGALRYEQSWYMPETANWADLRWRDGSSMARPGTWRCTTAWCHGAPGIIASRLGLLGAIPNTGIEAPLAATRAHFAATPAEEADLTLCHGALGLADILLCVAETESTPLDDKVRDFVVRALRSERLQAMGPGLMLGALGACLVGLRVASAAPPNSILLPPGLARQSTRPDSAAQDPYSLGNCTTDQSSASDTDRLI